MSRGWNLKGTVRFIHDGSALLFVLATLGTVVSCDSASGPRGEQITEWGPAVVPAGLKEFSECFDSAQVRCATGMQCTTFGAKSYCTRMCALSTGQGCSAGQACVAQPGATDKGICLRTTEHYALCGNLVACPKTAVCAKRCVPICNSGDSGRTAVATCPEPSATITEETPRCETATLAGITASFCIIDVAAGDPCDRGALRCDPSRPDTDARLEATTTSEADVGALACVLTGTENRCLRVCSSGSDVETNPADRCPCPADDPTCDDPQDPGMSWSCERLNAAGPVRVCIKREACTDDSPCRDNYRSGANVCRPSPFASGPSRICSKPRSG